MLLPFSSIGVKLGLYQVLTGRMIIAYTVLLSTATNNTTSTTSTPVINISANTVTPATNFYSRPLPIFRFVNESNLSFFFLIFSAPHLHQDASGPEYLAGWVFSSDHLAERLPLIMALLIIVLTNKIYLK